MSEQPDRFVPAAGRAAFTGAYDTVMALTMRERLWRPVLVRELGDGLAEGASVIDVGAGTGTIAIELASARPDQEVVAVDPDPAVRQLARAKPGAGAVSWRDGRANQLPVADAGAERVVMSLLLHHLNGHAKRAALREAYRVLRAGGELHIADWGKASDPLMRTAFLALQLVDGFAGTRDHVAGRLPSFIAEAGFSEPVSYRHLRTSWGSLELMRARRA